MSDVKKTSAESRAASPRSAESRPVSATSAERSAASLAVKRRFLIRLVAVLCGGMFLDGYILGIIGTVIGRSCRTTATWMSPLRATAVTASSMLSTVRIS